MILRPLVWTEDAERASRSRFVWLDHEDGRYSLSPLGIINGLLPSGWMLLVKRGRQ